MKKLSHSEMKQIKGGYMPPSDCSAKATNCDVSCKCTGSGTNVCGAADNSVECDCDGTKTTKTCSDS